MAFAFSDEISIASSMDVPSIFNFYRDPRVTFDPMGFEFITKPAAIKGCAAAVRCLTALGIPMNWTPQPLPYGRGSVTGGVCLQVVTEPRP